MMDMHWMVYGKYVLCLMALFLFSYDPIGCIPSSSMYNDKKTFRKESILLYERYKKNKDPCYTKVMEMLESECSSMNPSTKIMIAAHMMNCQYKSAGRTTHWFNESCSTKDDCLDKLDTYFKDLGADKYNMEMIALYFTHVDIICYYMNRVDWNKRYYAQLEQISYLSEEVWNQLEKVQQQNYDLLVKQNNSKNVIYVLSSITASSYSYIKNASNQLVVTLSSMNVSAHNSKALLIESLGSIFDVFHRLEHLVRAGLWSMHKFGGILFFTVLSLYIVFITNITNTKYTRTKLMIALWLLFVVDASMVFSVVTSQPLKHLNRYVVVVRACCVVFINLMWALLSYYIPIWIPISPNLDISYIVEKSRRLRGSSGSQVLQKSLNAVSAIKKAQTETISILNDARKRTAQRDRSDQGLEASGDYDDEKFVTGMEQLPKPNSSVLSQESEHPSLLSTSAKYFHNVVDSINLVSPARRLFGSLRPNFATSTVIRESTNKKPLSPQILKRSTPITNVASNVDPSFNARSPFAFKIPIKNVLPSDTEDRNTNLLTSTAAKFYGNKGIPSPSKPLSAVGEQIVSSTKHELKPTGAGRKTSRKIQRLEYNAESDITTEESSDAPKRTRGRKSATTNKKTKSKIPTAETGPRRSTGNRKSTRRTKNSSTVD